MSFTKVTTCRACGNGQLMPYLNLGTQPLANSYEKDGERFPLELMLCRNCFHSQLSVVVDPEVLYKHYLYTSGTSFTIREYSNWFASVVSSQRQNIPGKVLDIACNDGTQLDAFKAMWWETYGVDPAENIAPVAIEKGHQVVVDFWGDRATQQFPLGTKFDVITAQNVFAHTDDIHGFLMACQPVMHDASLLYIQTSQSEMILHNEFDTVYHEHLSFFTTLSMYNAVARAGMVLENVYKANIHGTSYIFVVSLNGHVMPDSNVEEVMRVERVMGLYDERTYIQFAANAQTCVTALSEYVQQQRASGKKVIGYGAAAKGMTVLNFGNITLDYIVDDAPLKQDKFASGMGIPIYAPSKLFIEPEDVVIIPLAWNFFNEIERRIKAYRSSKNDIYVRYFPKLTTSESLR